MDGRTTTWDASQFCLINKNLCFYVMHEFTVLHSPMMSFFSFSLFFFFFLLLSSHLIRVIASRATLESLRLSSVQFTLICDELNHKRLSELSGRLLIVNERSALSCGRNDTIEDLWESIYTLVVVYMHMRRVSISVEWMSPSFSRRRRYSGKENALCIH